VEGFGRFGGVRDDREPWESLREFVGDLSRIVETEVQVFKGEVEVVLEFEAVLEVIY
jgi:hypothetical protein